MKIQHHFYLLIRMLKEHHEASSRLWFSFHPHSRWVSARWGSLIEIDIANLFPLLLLPCDCKHIFYYFHQSIIHPPTPSYFIADESHFERERKKTFSSITSNGFFMWSIQNTFDDALYKQHHILCDALSLYLELFAGAVYKLAVMWILCNC